MTNAMIILVNQVELFNQGILKCTGRYLDSIGPDGVITKIPEIQPIHTFNGWKALGYRVKKGEKAIVKFPIWKWTSKNSEEVDEEEQEKGYCFMKMSAFFTNEQVEKIEE